MNTIWEVKPKPLGIWGWIRSRFLSFATVLGLAFLFMVSTVGSAVVTGLGSRMSGGNAVVAFVLTHLVSLIVMTVLFGLIFKLLPDAKMEWRVALGVVTAVLFEIGKCGSRSTSRAARPSVRRPPARRPAAVGLLLGADPVLRGGVHAGVHQALRQRHPARGARGQGHRRGPRPAGHGQRQATRGQDGAGRRPCAARGRRRRAAQALAPAAGGDSGVPATPRRGDARAATDRAAGASTRSPVQASWRAPWSAAWGRWRGEGREATGEKAHRRRQARRADAHVEGRIGKLSASNSTWRTKPSTSGSSRSRRRSDTPAPPSAPEATGRPPLARPPGRPRGGKQN